MNQIYICDKCKQQYQITQPGEYQCQCGEKFTVAPMPQCPFCKSDVAPDALKCPNCGEWIKQKPKSRTTYLILAFLFGNWGVAEFYVGRYVLAILYIILSAGSFAFSDYQICLGILWIIQFILALCLGVNNTKSIENKKASNTFFYITASLALVVIVSAFAIVYFLTSR